MDDHIVPKKSLGQHWLHDEDSLLSMVNASQLTALDNVVEIGPGLGTLTKYLVARAGRVYAVEFDKTLADGLVGRVTVDNLSVHHEDCLAFDYNSLPPNYKVVANIPYYLTSNLLRILSESLNPPQTIVLLIQKEVAERVAAKPGDMSLLSVSIQLYYEVQLDRVISAKLFTPPPKIDSQIIKLVRRTEPLFADIDNRKFFKVVKAGFAQRRKKLRSSISAGLHIDKKQASELLLKADIDPNLRPQELTLQQWHVLHKLVPKL
ncbi:ribosomal RNA small subunit methyltransferase A [Candidatus Saccharibacteria bacterium]|nr:ribosomal RNA small subunit methyltransferase A [Candidatus Saccharibacteria bacterium]